MGREILDSGPTHPGVVVPPSAHPIPAEAAVWQPDVQAHPGAIPTDASNAPELPFSWGSPRQAGMDRYQQYVGNLPEGGLAHQTTEDIMRGLGVSRVMAHYYKQHPESLHLLGQPTPATPLEVRQADNNHEPMHIAVAGTRRRWLPSRRASHMATTAVPLATGPVVEEATDYRSHLTADHWSGRRSPRMRLEEMRDNLRERFSRSDTPRHLGGVAVAQAEDAPRHAEAKENKRRSRKWMAVGAATLAVLGLGLAGSQVELGDDGREMRPPTDEPTPDTVLPTETPATDARDAMMAREQEAKIDLGVSDADTLWDRMQDAGVPNAEIMPTLDAGFSELAAKGHHVEVVNPGTTTQWYKVDGVSDPDQLAPLLETTVAI